MSSHGRISVLIADDHPVVRAGIVGVINKESDINVIAETGEGERVEQLTTAEKPDVLVLDINMPGLDPVEVTQRLTTSQALPGLRVLVLTAYDDEAHVTGLLAAGAEGYVLKDEALDTLVEAIRAVAKGESWLSQRVAGKLARRAIHRKRSAEIEPLTQREREVLHHLALGQSNEQIAQSLFITKRTVQNHVSNIYAKLRLSSRAEAVLYAIRNQIVGVDEVTGT